MRSILFLPPLSQISGGLANLCQTARDLRELNYDVALVCPDDNAVALSDMRKSEFAFLPWNKLPPSPSDIWIIPESCPNALSPGIRQGASARPAKPIRVAWMPRKNKAMAEQIHCPNGKNNRRQLYARSENARIGKPMGESDGRLVNRIPSHNMLHGSIRALRA
ncbi:MAG: hypothetical protein LBD42_07335 [Desulfovibrio sp.]|jgi:hypothetical protein|nr:hypothetical protein [Desulfovibrio sp.]